MGGKRVNSAGKKSRETLLFSRQTLRFYTSFVVVSQKVSQLSPEAARVFAGNAYWDFFSDGLLSCCVEA